jgi:hypothetical protein
LPTNRSQCVGKVHFALNDATNGNIGIRTIGNYGNRIIADLQMRHTKSHMSRINTSHANGDVLGMLMARIYF